MKKNVPDRLHLVFRKTEPRDEKFGVGQFYDTPGGGASKISLDDAKDFVDLGCQSAWESSTESLPSIINSQKGLKSMFASPKSTSRVKGWFLHRKSRRSETTPVSRIETPKTAPAYLGTDFKFHHARSVPNLKIDPPKLTLEQLAKIDAFYAPTPVLPETPAPHLGKVYPSWSPDIDYRFNPRPSRSNSLRVGPISIKTAGLDRGYSRVEGLKRLKALDLVSETPESKGFLQPPTSPCSEVTLCSDDQRSRSKTVYSNIKGNMVLRGGIRMAAESKAPADSFSQHENLYFTMGESPIVGRGEVTLRFIEGPLDGPLSDICPEMRELRIG
ncbi:hypothetical protein F5887DRAFT_991659 [Amanita rubescens]|nr:hypothetical protein F5887DRAFT_991659 [Amanita rubescens]